MKSSLILSLAILKTNWERLRKDYIENFVLFVAQTIAEKKPDVVSLPELQNDVEVAYGFQIPQNVLRIIIKRLERQGYLRVESGAYYPQYGNLNKLEFNITIKNVLEKHQALVTKLCDFAKNNYTINLDNKEAEKLIEAYIKEHDMEIISCLMSNKSMPESTTLSSKNRYVINAFIRNLNDMDIKGMAYLDSIIKGHILANALIFPDSEKIYRRFQKTAVYFDTSLVVRALGYEGDARKEPCTELIDLLQSSGAHTLCFSQTYSEVYNILYATMSILSQRDTGGVYGPTIRYLLDSGYTQGDMAIELAKLERNLRALGIEVVDVPRRIPDLQIDEEALQAIVTEVVAYRSERVGAIIHDVDCLSAIYRLRSGRSFFSIEDSEAIFVTSNSSLCQASNRYFRDENLIENNAVPIAITDYVLTTLVWLKKPSVSPDLPRKQIIAESYAAMEPGLSVWRKYLDEIELLKTRGNLSEDDYYILRSMPQARFELADITIGVDEGYTEGTSLEILERVRQNIRAEDLEKLEKEKILRQKTELKLERELINSAKREEGINLRIESFSRKIAFILSRLIFILIIILLFTGAVFSIPLGSWGIKPIILRWIILGCVILFVFLGIYTQIKGTTVKNWIKKIEAFVYSRVESIIKKWLLSS